jgi:signal transduction histidine kinase
LAPDGRAKYSAEMRHAGETATVISGGGEMGALMRSIDWSRTAVGPVSGWPQSLRTALSILLETGFPMYIAWGPEFTQFYNDGYRPILGSTKHPAAMGISTRETFAEIWDIIGPMFLGVMEGTPTTVVDFLLPLDRHGFIEECYFIFSYSPIRQEDGTVGGVLVTVTETTQRVLGERRLKTSQALAARTRDALTVRRACELAAGVLAENSADLPFALVYLLNDDGTRAVLAGASGLHTGTAASPLVVDLEEPGGSAWPLAPVARRGEPMFLDALPEALDSALPQNALRPRQAAVLPIRQQGASGAFGLLVAATSPRLIFDEAYASYLGLIASQIGGAIASARALEDAKARADALAELDRAKTAFFSNVSHEFRTPLTLMLGPTEEALASHERALRGQDLETVHRNELRLLKLVNTLLDFSRIEAGRMRATYEPTDLAALTTDLSSAFRSAVEAAGLQLSVECPPLPAPVFVDREMWEKIVLNLLSNAFKYTFTGGIHVKLTWHGPHVALAVRDTGVGIAAEDLPRVFERFHRVENARARTHEGSGIGLALVRELVSMHHGTIEVSSVPGEGSTFTVNVPTGSAHLPVDQIGVERALAPASRGATPYVEEALRWLPEQPAGADVAEAADLSRVRILVADDNADMRDYVVRLLEGQWAIEAVADGQRALEAIERRRPDLIISDVMMPLVDGIELLRRIRADERTRSVPVILLSARAGEESRIDGLEAGADDYLVKPFSARELIARVQAQIVRAKIRSIEEEHALRLASVFSHAPVGIAILRGPDHLFEYANERYAELVGRRPLAGRTVREALPEVEGQGIVALLDRVYQTGEPYVGRSLRLMLQHPDGTPQECFFDFVYQPLLEENAEVTGIAAVVFEVTELARARREAEAASRAKDEFLAMLGHELRNPLAPILTALQLMRLRGVEGAERERMVIERQVKHVVALVDDLLDVSRIARGKVELRRERVDIGEIVSKALEMTSPAFEERGHAVHVDVPRGVVVLADPSRLAQVFANLLSNAAKYTDAGGRIGVTGHVDGGSAVVSVSDNGVGIAKEMLPRVFDLFTQERQAIDRSQGGLGLGLAIVRSLVEAHGGHVSVHSDGRGTGAEFTVALPLAVAEEPAEAGAAPPETAEAYSCRVLIVDDNPDAAELLAESLQAIGHTTYVAYDGPSALEAADVFLPEVALLDLGLPVMDGFELAQRLRADERFSSTRLVAVTGYGTEADRERTKAAGFDGHMVKPIDIERVDAFIRAERAASFEL